MKRKVKKYRVVKRNGRFFPEMRIAFGWDGFRKTCEFEGQQVEVYESFVTEQEAIGFLESHVDSIVYEA